MNRDRGQLILVGAIAIALILLGLVLIVNTALFTQVVGSEGTTQTVKEGGVTGQGIGDSIASIVAEENRAAGGLSSINTRTDTNVSSTLEAALANRNLESGGSFVSVEYLGYDETGTRIAQDDPADFTSAVDQEGWDLLNSTERSDVGEFVLVIDTVESDFSSDFEIVINGSNGNTTAVRIDDAGSGSVDLEVDGPPDSDCPSINATNGAVRIDVSNGRVYEDSSCQFDAFANLEPGYTVHFEDGDEVNGTYQLVSDRQSIIGNLDPRFDSASTEPTRTDAIWSFVYRFEYDTSKATVESERREVEVYD